MEPAIPICFMAGMVALAAVAERATLDLEATVVLAAAEVRHSLLEDFPARQLSEAVAAVQPELLEVQVELVVVVVAERPQVAQVELAR